MGVVGEDIDIRAQGLHQWSLILLTLVKGTRLKAEYKHNGVEAV